MVVVRGKEIEAEGLKGRAELFENHIPSGLQVDSLYFFLK